MNELYIYQERFKTRYVEFDFQDKLKMSAIFAYLQEAAGIGSERMGCGTDLLWPNGWGFIVTGYHLEVYKDIPTGSHLTVKTWALPPKFAIYERQFVFTDDSGEKVACASSRWCLFDINNQSILQLSVLDCAKNKEDYCTEKAIEKANWKLPFDEELEGRNADFSMKVHSSECDRYMHVNNTRYADYCMNCFTMEERKNKSVKCFRISYESQCVEGDELYFYKTLLNEDRGVYLITGLRKDKSRFLRAEITII